MNIDEATANVMKYRGCGHPLVETAAWLLERLSVKCEHPSVGQCAKLWQEDTNQRQLAGVSQELADEFPWGCDTVEKLATALLASRAMVQRMGAESVQGTK